MEEFIKYFYNIKVDKITNKGDRAILENKYKKYQLINYNKDPNELYNKYIILKNNGVFCHDILLNRNGMILSNYNDRSYLLLKENISIKSKIGDKELLNNKLIINYQENDTIKNKWQIKNDYYEDQINRIYKDNKYIEESFDYYLGLSELAINLLNYINFNNIIYYAEHNRLTYDETLVDYYNPLNMVIDSRVRDFASYIKSNFFENVISFSEVETIINMANLNNDEALFFMARLLYPDYYFDICDEIINENYNNDKLVKYIKKNVSYETFLRNIYTYLYNKYNMPKIEFLFT